MAMTTRWVFAGLLLSALGCTSATPAEGGPVHTIDVPLVYEFTAAIDPAEGTLTFTSLSLDTAASLDAIHMMGEDGVGARIDALTELTNTQDGMPGVGPADSIELVTVASGRGSMTSFGNCGALPPGTTDCFWGDVDLRSFFGSYLGNVYAEIYAMTPTSGYEAYGDLSQSHFNRSHAYGLWRYGTLEPEAGDPANAADNGVHQYATRRWTFRLPASPGPFNFRGRVLATIYAGASPAPHLTSLPSTGDLPSGRSLSPAISDDGLFAAYARDGMVWRHERRTGLEIGIGSGSQPSISDDGRFVAYVTSVGGIALADVTGSTVTSVAVYTPPSSSCRAQLPDVSGAGEYVVFESNCTDLCTGLTGCITGRFHVYRWRATSSGDCAAADIVPCDISGARLAAAGFNASVSDDGRYVAFDATGANLAAGDTNATRDVFVRDVCTGVTTLLSRGTANNGAPSSAPHISASGDYIVYETLDPSGFAGDANGTADVVRVERSTRARELLSGHAGVTLSGASTRPRVSADGCSVVFVSGAALTGGDTNGLNDVYVVDACAATAPRLVSTTGFDNLADQSSSAPALSSDGRYAAFVSTARNLSEDVDAFPNSVVERVYTIALP